MPSIFHRSFAAGEVSPGLYARGDLVKYQTGLKVCRNFQVMKSGGVENRAGTRFIAAAKEYHRGIPFVYSAEQSYRLEMGNGYMRVIRNGVLLAPSVGGAWAPATAYAVGDVVSFGGTIYYARVAHTSPGSFVADSNWYAMPSSGIYEIPTPYSSQYVSELNFDQSADVMTFTHPMYPPYELKRFGHTRWTLTPVVFAPTIVTPPAPTSVTGGDSSGTLANRTYKIALVDPETFEESYPGPVLTGAGLGPATIEDPIIVAFATVELARVYKEVNGRFGYIGDATGTSFKDEGQTPDMTAGPVEERAPFGEAGLYPATSTYYQQRHIYGGSLDAPEHIEASRVGLYSNFTRSYPGGDDDAIPFSLAGPKVNEVRHLLDLGSLVVLTGSSEIVIQGGDAGAITPTQINAKTRGYSGASKVTPAVVQDSAVFVQARGNILRDLKYQPEADGYVGRDLAVFASHLFEGKEILQLGYAENPHSIIWVRLDDGSLAGLTYLREHELWGWHRHDFENGYVEDITIVPEGTQDALYISMRRVINGVTVRYIERMDPRWVEDSRDWCFLDSALSYDGRRDASDGTAFLSRPGGLPVIANVDLLFETPLVSTFVPGDVGNVVVMRQPGARDLRLTITAYENAFRVTVRCTMDPPSGYASTPWYDWGIAKDVFLMPHLANQTVYGLADGSVVGPFALDGAGTIELALAAEVLTIGLPITAEIETLPIDPPSSEPVRNRKMQIRDVVLILRRSRGGWVGVDRDRMTEIPQRAQEHYDDPIAESNRERITLSTEWGEDQTVIVQQRDPLPMSLLGMVPNVMFGGK